MTTKTDFTFVNHGSICILTPVTRRAQEWAGEHIDAPTSFGKGIVVEPRFADHLLAGIEADGLAVS